VYHIASWRSGCWNKVSLQESHLIIAIGLTASSQTRDIHDDRGVSAEPPIPVEFVASQRTIDLGRELVVETFEQMVHEARSTCVLLLDRMAAHNAEISRLHQARPAGVALHLVEPERVARGLENFSTASPSITKELRLPAFEPANRSPGRRRSHPWQRCTRCRRCRSTTRVTARIGGTR
jgi:hypothetical protein